MGAGHVLSIALRLAAHRHRAGSVTDSVAAPACPRRNEPNLPLFSRGFSQCRTTLDPRLYHRNPILRRFHPQMRPETLTHSTSPGVPWGHFRAPINQFHALLATRRPFRTVSPGVQPKPSSKVFQPLSRVVDPGRFFDPLAQFRTRLNCCRARPLAWTRARASAQHIVSRILVNLNPNPYRFV